MIPKYAIFATDDNPHYDGLWPIVSEICLKKTGIIPVLLRISDEESDFVKDTWGIVKNIKKLENHPKHFQSQVVRMWGTKFFADDVCIISDIDMLMFNREYFVDQVRDCDKESMVLYTSDAYDASRPECVGVHRDRYAICYNAATGRTFDKLLGTSVSLQDYCDRIASIYDSLFDADELYFTERVKSCNDIRFVMLKRGYYTKFQAPRRIERVSDDEFNQYDPEKLRNGHYVDCHLARPYSRYKMEIDEIKDIILHKSEVYIIGAHIDNERQENYLRELVDRLETERKEFVICSHTMIPQDIASRSLAFIYDSVNTKMKIWDLKNPNKHSLSVGPFTILSPYVSYGRNNYHIGVLRNLINGLKYASSLGRDVAHWIEYDALPDFEEDRRNIERLDNFDFVFYGIGAKFSFRIDSINEDLLTATDRDLSRMLETNNNVAEAVIGTHLVTGNKYFIPVESPEFFGRHSHHESTGYDWSLYEENGLLNIFNINYSDKKTMTVKTNHHSMDIIMEPGFWNTRTLGTPNEITELSIVVDGEEVLSVEHLNPLIYEKLVSSVTKINH